MRQALFKVSYASCVFRSVCLFYASKVRSNDDATATSVQWFVLGCVASTQEC